MFSTRLLTAFIALAAIAVPTAGFAQSNLPDPASAQPGAPAPSSSRPSYSSDEDVVRGQIVSFDGGYNLQVRDDRGFVDSVALHQGTIINPTGLRLSPGMSVTVRGVNRGHVLDANQIDTPYQTYGVAYSSPIVVTPYYAYPYGFVPAYGFGYGYPVGGVSVGIGIGFGGYYRAFPRYRWR